MQTSLGDPTGSKKTRAPRVLEKQPGERIPLQPKEATSHDLDVVIGSHGERITPRDPILLLHSSGSVGIGSRWNPSAPVMNVQPEDTESLGASRYR